MRVAEQYVEAFGNVAKSSTTMLLPGNVGDVGSMVAQALAVYNKLSVKEGSAGAQPARKPNPVSKEFIPAKF